MIISYKIPTEVTQTSLTAKGNNMSESIVKLVGLIVTGILVITCVGLIFSLPIMWLWNACLVPAIPGITTIGWLQAWGINILFGILFKPSQVPNKS